jgi:hypothetical protein
VVSSGSRQPNRQAMRFAQAAGMPCSSSPCQIRIVAVALV